MKQLTTSSLFSLLARPTREEDYQEKLENAYDEFITKVLQLHEKESDMVHIIRKLNFARAELMALEISLMCEKGRKCNKNLHY